MNAFTPNKPAASASAVLALVNPLCSSLDAERVAQRCNKLAFGLPDNPLAHFVCLNLYVRAALEAFMGQSARTAFTPGVLAADITEGGNTRETFRPARWLLQDGSVMLTPLRWSNSGDLTSLATTNALIRVTAGAEQFQRGSRVEFVRTERSG